MKKLLLAPALLLGLNAAHAQLALENFNGPGIPAGWTMINVDGKTISSTLNTKIVSGLATNAWMKWPVTSSDSMMITTSLFSPAGTCDRWLITPSFNVTSTDVMLNWYEAQPYSASGGKDIVEIWVSTTGGATTADFTTKLVTTTPSSATLSKRRYSLAAFNGQTVKVAFRSVGTNAGVVSLDNINTDVVPALTDLQLTTITPASGSSQSYGTSGASISGLGGVVVNNGTGAVTSFKAYYKVGAGAPVSQTITPASPILSLGSTTFTFTTPPTFPAAGADVKVWVELTGDATPTNDSGSTYVSGYTTKPNKVVLYEEGTGTWCQWCPRGAIYMDSIHKAYPTDVSVVAVHNSDPMTVAAYDAYMSSNFYGGYPGMAVDRRISDDPSTAFSYYSSEDPKFGVAEIAVTSTISGTSFTIKADVTPSVNTKANYKLALVVTEDRVSGTASGYAQKNAYSGGGAGPMGNAEFNFVTLPSTVPASIMKYDFVARGIYPSVTGGVGTLPATMTAGTKYSYTFPAITVPSTWNINKLKAIVLLINGDDESVLNTNNVTVTKQSITEKAAGVSGIDVYPNPASEVLNTRFSLDHASNVNVQLVDMLGKVVKNIQSSDLTPGTYDVATKVTDLASGIYVVKISTDNGTITQRVSIAK